MIGILLTCGLVTVVALPYTLVLCWCAILRLGESFPHMQIPDTLRPVLIVGGIISLEARHDRFWTFMLWFPAFTILNMVSNQAAVCILFLHLITFAAIHLNGRLLDGMLRPLPVH